VENFPLSVVNRLSTFFDVTMFSSDWTISVDNSDSATVAPRCQRHQPRAIIPILSERRNHLLSASVAMDAERRSVRAQVRDGRRIRVPLAAAPEGRRAAELEAA
jgi:hypothetical protein